MATIDEIGPKVPLQNPAGAGEPITAGRNNDSGDDAHSSSITTGDGNVSTSGVNNGNDSLRALFDVVHNSVDARAHATHTEEIDFNSYLERGHSNPNLFRTSAQRIYDMILAKGRKPIEVDGETIYDYGFFKDTVDPEDSISGQKRVIHNLVEAIGGAAKETGPHKRVILLAGPVGSVKTTLVRALFTGLEQYSTTDEGALFALKWDLTGQDGKPLTGDDGQPLFKYVDAHKECEMFEDPLNVIQLGKRKQLIGLLNQKRLQDVRETEKTLDYTLSTNCHLCPSCRDISDRLLDHYKGDIKQVLKHVKAKRLVLDQDTRTGLTFFGAKDEKSHNAAELTGGVNMRKLLQIGTDSHPQAITLDGDVFRGNRGGVHFGEFLKLPKEITYPLLDGAQDRSLKVTKNALVAFDTFMIGTTNIPDWKRVLRDEFQEAIRSRIYPVTVSYLDRIQDEMGIYGKNFSQACKKLDIHEAPHGRWAAALWALTTRLADPTERVSMIQKAYLYSGKHLKGFTQNEVIEMRKKVPEEAMELLRGISPRDVQDALSSALEHPDVTDPKKGTRCVDPFLIIDALERRLQQPIVNTTAEDKKKWLTRLKEVERELDKKLLDDVRKAVSGDEKEIINLFDNYIAHVRGYVEKERVRDRFQGGRLVEPNEKLMRPIEDKIGISEARKDEYRKGLIQTIGLKALGGEQFKFDTDENLKQALEEALLEKHKDVSLPTLSQEYASTEQLEKIQLVQGRLINKHGYCKHCASIAMRRTQAPENRGPST